MELYVSKHNFLKNKLSEGISVKTLRKVILFPKKCLTDFCLRQLIFLPTNISGKSVSGKYVSGKSVSGKSVSGKSVSGNSFCLPTKVSGISVSSNYFCLPRYVSGTSVSETSVPGNSFSLPKNVSGNICQKSQGIKVKSLTE